MARKLKKKDIRTMGSGKSLMVQRNLTVMETQMEIPNMFDAEVLEELNKNILEDNKHEEEEE